MAGFDTTNVAAQINPPTNPLQTIEGLAQLQNTVNQNKLFQARQLAGQYQSQATGPDGQTDLGKFSSALQSDPRTAPFAQEALQAVASLRGTGLSNQQAALGVAGTQMDNARKIIAAGGVGSTNPDPNAADVENRRNAATQLAIGVQNGLVSPDVYSNIVNSPDFGNIIKSAAISGAGGDIARQAVAPNITSVSTPQGTNFVSENPVLGQVNKPGGSASFVPNQLGPQDLATPVDTVNSDGSKSRHILGDLLNSDSTWKSGTTPPLIDAGPLNTTARSALGAAYGPQIANFEAEVSAAPQTKALIDQMRTASGQFQTGPNADFWKRTGELASEYGVKNFDPGNTATSASEAFTKIIPTLLRQQASMLGMNETDTGRQISAASIPSKDLTPEGVNKILGILEGNVDAINAQGKGWQQEKAQSGEGSYGNYRMNFAQKVPPTIFQSQYMTPQELQDMQKGWTTSQKSDWERRKQIAQQKGWLPNAQ